MMLGRALGQGEWWSQNPSETYTDFYPFNFYPMYVYINGKKQ